MGLEQGVDRGVSVAVREQRGPAVVDPLHPPVERGLGERQLAAPVLLARGAVREVGLREARGAALRRAVGHDLHAADPQPVPVLRLVAGRPAAEDRVDLRDERERHDVELEQAAVGHDPQQVELVLHRGPFLGRGDALPQVELLARLQQIDALVVVRSGHLGEDRQEGRLEEQPIRLLGAGLAADHAAGRRRGGGRDAVGRQGPGVEHRAMAGDVDEEHGIVGKGGVEFLFRGRPPLGEQVGVVAEADDEPPRPELAPLLDLLQARDHVGHAAAGARRRRRAQGLRLHIDQRPEVAVAIDEARHERLAGQIGDHGAGPLAAHDVGLGADGHDPPAGDRHRFRRGLRGVHRDDRPTADDAFGRRGGCLAGDRDEGDGEGDERDVHDAFLAGRAVCVDRVARV